MKTIGYLTTPNGADLALLCPHCAAHTDDKIIEKITTPTDRVISCSACEAVYDVSKTDWVGKDEYNISVKTARALRTLKAMSKHRLRLVYENGTIWAENPTSQVELVHCDSDHEARKILRTLKLGVK